MEAILKFGKKLYFPKEIRIDSEKEKILKILLTGEKTLKEISKELKISPQLAFFKLKKLIEEGFVEKKGRFYFASNSYFLVLSHEGIDSNIIVQKNFLKYFAESGFLNCYLVVGNMDPHGEFSARARDVHLAAYISLHLGKICEFYREDFVKFDTEILSKNLLKENLIVIGGPVTNTVAYKLNTVSKIRFLQELNWCIFSEFSRKIYDEEFGAIITLFKNPWNKNKKILWIAGRRNVSTKIAIDFLSQINDEEDFYYIISGKDLDGDGKIDKVEVLENGKYY